MSTFKEQAQRLVFIARNLTERDAVEAIALEVEHIHIRGEKAGIEAARQSIRQLGQVEAA